MIVTGARYADGELHLVCSPRDGVRASLTLKPGKDYEIVPAKKKRSLDANAYAWALINRIAESVHEAPVVIYRRYIRDIGSKRSVCTVPIEDVELECKTFTANHIGRLVSVGESEIYGCATVIKIYGSSDYDVRQMAAFIDQIIQDAQALGIETRDPNDVASLLAGWGRKKERENANA